jgi:hypothetical protein
MRPVIKGDDEAHGIDGRRIGIGSSLAAHDKANGTGDLMRPGQRIDGDRRKRSRTAVPFVAVVTDPAIDVPQAQPRRRGCKLRVADGDFPPRSSEQAPVVGNLNKVVLAITLSGASVGELEWRSFSHPSDRLSAERLARGA